jgi:hypothetical protein
MIQSRFLIKPNYLNEQKHQSHKNKKMNNLKKNRLNKLNKLLMEQERPSSMKRAAARRNRGDAKQPPKSVKKSGILSTMLEYLKYKGGEAILKKALKKAGIKVGKKQIEKKLLIKALQKLGPEGMAILSTELAAGATGTAGAAGAAGTVGVGSAVGAGLVLAAAGHGAAMGYGLNYLLSSPQIDKEIKTRLEKARKDIDYAKAELDVYCKGRGSLCKDDVKCSGKPGGYVYSKFDGYETYLGLGAGRELFGVPGFRKFKQTKNSFHANDGAMMIGLAFELILHDIKKGLVVLPNQENKLKDDQPTAKAPVAEFKNGSVSKEYEQCIKKWITRSRVMLSQVKKFNLEKAYKELRWMYGIDAFPSDLPDKKPGASPTPDSGKGPRKCDNYPITKGCVGDPVGNLIYIAVGGTKSGPDMAADSTNEFNQAEVEKLIDAGVLNDKVIKLVSQILKAEGALDVLKTWKANNFTIKSGDKVDRWLDVTASRKGMTENLDFYRKLKKSKSDKLANILMEGIK